MKFQTKYITFLPSKCIWKCLPNVGHFVWFPCQSRWPKCSKIACPRSHISWGRFISLAIFQRSMKQMKSGWTLIEFKDGGYLTHSVTHICVGNLTNIGSDNGLSPGRRQAIIWTNAGVFLIESLGTNYSEILIGILIFSFKKMRLEVSSAKWQPFCLGLKLSSSDLSVRDTCVFVKVSLLVRLKMNNKFANQIFVLNIRD